MSLLKIGLVRGMGGVRKRKKETRPIYSTASLNKWYLAIHFLGQRWQKDGKHHIYINCNSTERCYDRLILLVNLQNSHKRFLWNLYGSYLFHTFFTFFLFL